MRPTTNRPKSPPIGHVEHFFPREDNQHAAGGDRRDGGREQLCPFDQYATDRKPITGGRPHFYTISWARRTEKHTIIATVILQRLAVDDLIGRGRQ